MSADQRVSIAREYLATVRQHKVSTLPPSVLVREVAELRRQLGLVLDAIDQAGPARPPCRYNHEYESDCGPGCAPAEPGKLAAIRAVLAAFDWEQDDRQLALEHIERIMDGAR